MADKEKLNRQKESIRLEKEYQQTLSFSAQIQRDINKEINIGVDGRTKSGKAVKEYNDNLMKGLSSLKSAREVAQKQFELEQENIRLQKSKNQYNKYEVDQKIASNDFAIEALGLEYERIAAAEKMDSIQKDVTSGIQNQINKISEFGNNLPIVGGLFKGVFGESFAKLNSDVSDAGKEMVTSFAKGGFSLKNLTASMSQFGSSMMAALAANPMVLLGIAVAGVAAAIYGVIKLIQLGIQRFKELDAAGKSFRNETGLLNSQTQGLVENIRAVNVEFANLGVSAEDVSKAAADFTNEFAGLEQPTQAVLGSMVTLNKNFGVGTQEASKLNKVFQNIGGLTAAQSQYLVGQTAEMAKMAGVAPQKVIKDMADSSEFAYKYFKGSPEELAKAAVQAAKLGTSIAEAGKVADSLLDFQSSISKELEASAMLGVNINLGQARYLAANGKILESQQAVVDQVANLGDLTKLNVYEQQALVEATGMEFDSLVNQQRIRERFGKLSEEQLAAATSLLDTGKDINSISQADLKAQSDKLALQQGMQSQMDKLQNGTKALKTGFSDMFQPMIAFFVPILTDVIDMLSSVLLPIFKVIGSTARIIFGILGAVMNVVMAIIKPIFAIGGAILGALFEPLNRVASALQPLFDKFAEFKDKVMQALQPIMGVIKSIGEVIGTVIGGAIGFVVDIFIFMFDTVFSIFSAIAGFVNDYLISPIMSFVNAIKGVFSSIGSFFGFGGEETANDGAVATSDSINDGVVQQGKVVSTDPADFLLATKNPQGLAEELSGGGGVNISMDGVIAELQSLKEAFLSNKDVYMDKTLVSATVTDTQERSGRQNRFGIQGA